MRGLSPDPNGKISILTRAGHGSTLSEIRGPQVCEIGSPVVLVDHFSAGASPSTVSVASPLENGSTVDGGFYTQAYKDRPNRLVLLKTENHLSVVNVPLNRSSVSPTIWRFRIVSSQPKRRTDQVQDFG
jgi:hypothetical protein